MLGYAKFFSDACKEEQQHAQLLADFVTMRGGTVKLQDVKKPDEGEYHDPETALEKSINLEKSVLQSLEALHKKASEHHDIALADVLETSFIPEQYKGLQQLGEMLSNVRRAGPGLGLMMLDLDLRRHPAPVHGQPSK